MARKLVKRPAIGQLGLGVQNDCTALYIRVSTQKQADEGFSLDAQKERLAAFCVAQGWQVSPDHIYVDAGISGKSTDRAAFQRMMQAAGAGAVKRIVAMKLDRLARNVKDFLGIVEELRGVGCDLVLIKESFDTSTPQGKFALTMFAAMAELEAATITERVMTGKVQKAQEGGYNGARCPLGYKYSAGAFTVDQDQAPIVQEVFQAFVSGSGMLAIAERFNAGGVATARGGKWYAATVRTILGNGFYAGLSQWGGVEVEGSHPAIISRELYEQAHSRLSSLKPGPAA